MLPLPQLMPLAVTVPGPETNIERPAWAPLPPAVNTAATALWLFMVSVQVSPGARAVAVPAS